MCVDAGVGAGPLSLNGATVRGRVTAQNLVRDVTATLSVAASSVLSLNYEYFLGSFLYVDLDVSGLITVQETALLSLLPITTPGFVISLTSDFFTGTSYNLVPTLNPFPSDQPVIVSQAGDTFNITLPPHTFLTSALRSIKFQTTTPVSCCWCYYCYNPYCAGVHFDCCQQCRRPPLLVEDKHDICVTGRLLASLCCCLPLQECPPNQAFVGGQCQPPPCNPCPDQQPTGACRGVVTVIVVVVCVPRVG